jgi:hypothetical protein
MLPPLIAGAHGGAQPARPVEAKGLASHGEEHRCEKGETKKEGKVSVDRDGSVRFTSPFAVPGPAVLYLSKP